jgi:sugar phosphate isomerase/epimerase
VDVLHADVDAPVGIGLCLAAFGGAPLATALEVACSVGLTQVDLPTDTSLGLADVVRLDTDPSYRATVLRAIRASPVRVTCVSNSRDAQLLLGPHGSHTDSVRTGSAKEKRAHGLRAAFGTIRLAADLGASHVRLMLGCPDYARWLNWWGSDVSWSDNIASWVDEAAPVLDAAMDAGVSLLVEPHPKQVAYDRLSAEELLAATGAQWPGVARLCIDPANLAAIGHDPEDAVRGWGDRLAAAHAKDLQRWKGRGAPQGTGWCRYGPQPHIRFRTLGSGELPWPSILGALLDEQFGGTVYIEHEDPLLPRRQGIAYAAQQLRSLLPACGPEGRSW